MSNQCKCTNPEGGGTTCPEQHVALCIRGKDRQCYGTCSPIPGQYKFESPDFGNWLQTNIYNLVDQYVRENFRDEYPREILFEKTSQKLPLEGTKTFSLGRTNIAVRYSLEFTKDKEGGSQYAYA